MANAFSSISDVLLNVLEKELKIDYLSRCLRVLQEKIDKEIELSEGEKKEYAKSIFWHFMYCPCSLKNNMVEDERGNCLGRATGETVNARGEKFIRISVAKSGKELLIPQEKLFNAEIRDNLEMIVFIVAP
ncbi:MAG: hypothetical protein A3H02_00575 [Candidatus Niyogibacteria bacterium RIFCSPLOWO2_12_FULL_41_13]|uniref:Uncharacterized protein n=1 Tax=Candidatus Niyogibacteria bacterium RIFCSPLOWO2_12_FULL_41_13 TaxID=1801726 RepID=A0A1G2F2T3_9BACT|nr:MAG: hypothetical protein A3H02_00575 [Candidatus Niyogibacteria bacterium RIFCSPLOWO2_12_FULL_41_13]